MASHSRTARSDSSAADDHDVDRTTKADRRAAAAAQAEAQAAAKQARAEAKAASATARAQAKAAADRSDRERKDAKALSKLHRKDAKASRKAAKAAAKASEAAAAEAATRPARVVDRLSDPKTAKRLVGIGKIIVPALAPFAIKAAVSTRGYLDRRRAHRLGVAPAEVAQFRGPTGATGARITGLLASLDQLAERRGNDLQVTRFVEVSRTRLQDLTAATQASASMPRGARARVLRAIQRELDGLSADLMTHLDVH